MRRGDVSRIFGPGKASLPVKCKVAYSAQARRVCRSEELLELRFGGVQAPTEMGPPCRAETPGAPSVERAGPLLPACMVRSNAVGAARLVVVVRADQPMVTRCGEGGGGA